MTSIDDLFKGANAPTKRKFENPSQADPSQAYKSAKLTIKSDVKQSTHASVADENNDDEVEAGPVLPPDLEEEGGDDEDGRFFGGGLEEDAKDAMDYLDAQDGEDAITEEKYDSSWLRKLALNFEKKVNKNSSLRAKYESDPTKFMESEGDLDEGIKNLSILSDHSELYEEFAKSTAATKLVELLAHDNNDIAIGAIEIISELTDEDVEAEQEQWDALVTAFLEADVLGLLVSNFGRFNEDNPEDASGVYHSLGVIENILSQPTNVDLIGKQTKLLTWLLNRIQKQEKSTSQNKQYASEILSILTQSSRSNRRHVIEADGVEILLTLLAPYRKNDPQKESEEEEYMENLFNCLTSLVDEPEGKVKFLEAEGVELCLLMVRDGKSSKSRSLKVLDHACGYADSTPEVEAQINGSGLQSKGKEVVESASNTAAPICEKLVEARGLKPIFSTYMKTKKHDPETTEHILGIFASLFRSLPGDSDARLRLLAKFLEKDYEKASKLVTLRRDYATRVAAFDAKVQDRKRGLSKEEQEAIDMENVASRLDEGLYCLERIDAVLAWLVAEDDGAKKAIVKALGERDETLADVQRTLRAQLNGLLEVEPAERDMLETLIAFLR
jgi:beta-catenin-like protein 1